MESQKRSLDQSSSSFLGKRMKMNNSINDNNCSVGESLITSTNLDVYATYQQQNTLPSLMMGSIQLYIITEWLFYNISPAMAKKDFHHPPHWLEKKSEVTVLLVEHLNESWPANPSGAWLISRRLMVFSWPVVTFAFHVT